MMKVCTYLGRKRMLNEYERQYWPSLVAGLDEAGRGPLCGPLTVGIVVFPPFYENDEINDSKKLSEKKREKLFEVIKNDALYYDIKIVDPAEIDELNIYRATKKAMEELANKTKAEIILSDAMPLNVNKETISIIKGDSKSISSAAASILAKVTRDHIMEEYDLIYPEYGFKKHKGYPTKAHLEALNKYGVLDIYRKTYGPVKALLNQGK